MDFYQALARACDRELSWVQLSGMQRFAQMPT
jgi:hypothetical protein